MKMKMLKKSLCLICSVLTILSMTSAILAEEPVDADPDKDGFQYFHDPMDDPTAAEDIIENPDAVYGFSPKTDSMRLGIFAIKVDFTDPEEVAMRRRERQEYHDSLDELYDLIEEMFNDQSTIEEIAAELSKKRNEIRLGTYCDDPNGLAMAKKAILKPTATNWDLQSIICMNGMDPGVRSLRNRFLRIPEWMRVLDSML